MRFWLGGTVLGLAFLAAGMAARGEEALDYRLGSGDEVKVTVFGEDDLSGTFILDGGGRAAMPLVGAVELGGRTPREAEAMIGDKLGDGYLKSPRVSVAVTNHRPFFILGEVKSPGSYPYQEGLSIVAAVAIGGGFTYRADEDDIEIVRKGQSLDATLKTSVQPGDVITVKERFF